MSKSGDVILGAVEKFGDYMKATSVPRVCRVCGCSQFRACPGGCYWVEDDLCSACVGKPAAKKAGA